MDNMIYKILRIDEDDYGCEARPDDYVPMVQVRIQAVKEDDFGEFEERVVLVEDSLMYQRNLDEGDLCIIGRDGTLYPGGMIDDETNDNRGEISKNQSEWMESYIEAIDDM